MTVYGALNSHVHITFVLWCDCCVLYDSCTTHREYADQLKASRDELAAVSKAEVGSAALTTLEKRTLLTQKASLEKMATEARR